MLKSLMACAVFAVSFSSAQAASVNPTSYDMLNGGTGSYIYHDESYGGVGATGNPNVSYQQLSGGLGNLTDGVIATQNWNAAGQTSSNPYVGWWNRFVAIPSISFAFDQMYKFSSLTVHYDVSYSGGVGPVTTFDAKGINLATIGSPISSQPASYTLDLLGIETDQIDLELSNSAPWIFVSEITFDGAAVAPVPLPAAGFLLMGALGGLGLMRRRNKS